MSQFNYDQYQNVVNRAQSAPSANAVRVGFFKLKDGEEALVRINVSKLDDLKFATVHKPVFGKKFEGLGTGYTPVSCLNEVGSYSDACPFCKAAAEGHEVIGKAVKVVYIQMLVAYKDASTGTFSAAVPVVWERPAGFSKELASKLRDYGSLADHVFKISRLGAGKDTRYSLDYIPLYDKPETVTTDFSVFNNFDITKHSFWIKPAADLQYFIDNGTFPATEQKPASASANFSQVAAAPAEEKKVEQSFGIGATPVQPTPVVKPTPVTEEKPATERPVRNFSGFSF